MSMQKAAPLTHIEKRDETKKKKLWSQIFCVLFHYDPHQNSRALLPLSRRLFVILPMKAVAASGNKIISLKKTFACTRIHKPKGLKVKVFGSSNFMNHLGSIR
jgi:hypothetical protein